MFFFNLKKHRVNSRNNAVVRRRVFDLWNSSECNSRSPWRSLSLFAAPPHPGVLRTQEEDRKPLWINDIPQLCVLGRLFNSFHVMTRQSCGGNEVVLAGGMWVWKAMGGQRQKVLKDKTARSVPKSRNGGEALQSGLLHSWALGQQKQHPRKKMQCSGTFVSSA